MPYLFEVKTAKDIYTISCSKSLAELGITKWHQVNYKTVPVGSYAKPLIDGLWVGYALQQVDLGTNVVDSYLEVRNAYSDIRSYMFSDLHSLKNSLGCEATPGHFCTVSSISGIRHLDEQNEEAIRYYLAYNLLLQKFNQLMEIEDKKPTLPLYR